MTTENYEFTLAKAKANLKMILTHKLYVFKACKRAGIPLRGLLHDMSKLSPTEFYEYTKYTANNRSPVDNCKDVHGYCAAWQHHKGRNPHHVEYWMDRVAQKGVEPIALLMPYEYATEMICDYIGAGQVYCKDEWTFHTPLEWWNEVGCKRRMHPAIEAYVVYVFMQLKIRENFDFLNSKDLKTTYDFMVENYNEKIANNSIDI